MRNYSCPHWVKSNYAPSVSNHADMLHTIYHVNYLMYPTEIGREYERVRERIKSHKKLIWLTVCQNKKDGLFMKANHVNDIWIFSIVGTARPGQTFEKNL